jgi:hypothetical protein
LIIRREKLKNGCIYKFKGLSEMLSLH